MSDHEQPFDTDLMSLFDDLFSVANRLPDVHATLKLTEDEAAVGVTRDVAIQRTITCTACEGGRGATPSDSALACAACDGTGGVHHQQGFFHVKTACPACKGVGVTIVNPCVPCTARGVVREPASVAVTVPAGATHGTTVRIADQGNVVADGTRGALLVYLVVGDRADTRADDARAAFERMLIEPGVPRAIVRRPGGNPVLTPPLILGLVIGAVLLLLGLVR
jgi:DnaJ-class molecular chaperone